jgi:hypothetical protein
MSDVIPVYRRIVKASLRGKGIRLSWADVNAIRCDGAVIQAIETADEEEQTEVEPKKEHPDA